MDKTVGAIEKGFAHLCQVIARSNYLSVMGTLANIGEISAEEFKELAKPVLQLDHFTCNADVWNRGNNGPLNRKEDEKMTDVMKENIKSLYRKGEFTSDIAAICDITESEVVRVLEDAGLLR